MLKTCFKESTKRKKKEKNIVDLLEFIQLNERFRQILSTIDLKTFKTFNKIKQ